MTDTMKALWLENEAIRFRDDVRVPLPVEGEALVRVRLAGICSTDLEMIKGYYPFTGILGHEFVGEVISAPGHPNWEAQRVVGEINVACGTCQECRAGRPTHCFNRSVLGIKNKNGAFAEYLTLPIQNLHPVPDAVTDDLAVFCEPLAAALEIQSQVHIQPMDRILVIGAGRLGQLVARTLAQTACQLFVLVRRENQRRLLEPTRATFLSHQALPRKYMDLVVDVTGSPEGFQIAREAVRPRGTIVLKSTYTGQVSINASALVVDEIKIIGSRCGPFEPALRMLAAGSIYPADMIEGQYPLESVEMAFTQAALPGTLKILLRPSGII